MRCNISLLSEDVLLCNVQTASGVPLYMIHQELIIYTRGRNARGMMVADDEGLSESLLLLLLSLYTLTPRPYIFNKRSDSSPPRPHRHDYTVRTQCTRV